MILQMLLRLLKKSIFSQKVHEEIKIVLKPMDMVSDYFVWRFYFHHMVLLCISWH